MVTIAFHQKILRNLEMYLIKESDYRLTGVGYDLILFIPTDYHSFDGRNMLVVSAKSLDNKREKNVVQDLLVSFKSVLSFEEFSIISSLKIINSNAPLVKNLNFAFPFQKRADVEYEINTTVGGVTLQNARLVRSSVLPNLVMGKVCSIELSSGEIIRGEITGIDNDFQVSVAPESSSDLSKIKQKCSFTDILSVQL